MRREPVIAEDWVHEDEVDLYFGYWDEVADQLERLDHEDRVTGREFPQAAVELEAAA